jgi:catechol 2,3-dioxygenase-like lactoylglutathione lyase family enzyme
VDDQAAAKQFYSTTLGLDVEEDQMGMTLKLAGGNDIFVYPKSDHQPATYTILNFVVKDIDKAVDELSAKNVVFEKYGIDEMHQDEKGIARGRAANMGPDIAWFKDPAGNILAVLQN